MASSGEDDQILNNIEVFGSDCTRACGLPVGLFLWTDDNNRRSSVQRKEIVEYITTMVKFSLVKRISGVLMLEKIPGLPDAVVR